MKIHKKTFIVTVVLLLLSVSKICFADRVTITDKGMKYFDDKNYLQALSCFVQGAKAKDPDAMFLLGHMYHKGLGVSQSDTEAMKWFKLAAQNGSTHAASNVGNMYFAQKAYKEAVLWFERASSHGNDAAMFQLGTMYDYGCGVKQNYSKAVEWYKKAAAAGNTKAICNLGTMYYYGRGVMQNKIEAQKYFYQAAELGDEMAKNFLRENFDYDYNLYLKLYI